jgi:ferredoxin-thioredoxin reductase catalytic subunit
MKTNEPSDAEIEQTYRLLKKAVEAKGHYFNPDVSFTKQLIRGLLVNRNRYGYMSCPCRVASRDIKKDADIICPCAYRNADVAEYGTCYCGLYVSEEVKNGKKTVQPIPERRPPEKFMA